MSTKVHANAEFYLLDLLQIKLISEAYLKPIRTSTMELFYENSKLLTTFSKKNPS